MIPNGAFLFLLFARTERGPDKIWIIFGALAFHEASSFVVASHFAIVNAPRSIDVS